MNQVTISDEKEANLNDRLFKALATNPETKDAAIEVINKNGFITLAGEVDTPKTRQAIRQVVANEPGVISIINNLKVTAFS